jgi:hypothetical protein
MGSYPHTDEELPQQLVLETFSCPSFKQDDQIEKSLWLLWSHSAFKSLSNDIYKKLPGANPTIASNNDSAVKIYNATCSLVSFENKNILFYYEKCSSLLQRWSYSCKFKSRRIGSWLHFDQVLDGVEIQCETKRVHIWLM